MKLIILAAGLGKRFLPITEKIPKGMVPVLGEPLLKHVLAPYLSSVTDIIFVVNNELGLQIKEYFTDTYFGHNIHYKIQQEQKGTLDALLTCKDLITANELFCVANGDDILEEAAIKEAIQQNIIGLGVSKRIMPRGYLGIEIKNGYALGFRRHEEMNEPTTDVYSNGFNILDRKVFDFEPVKTRDGELGLPHTLFANLDVYPLKTFHFEKWETVNGPSDIEAAEKFLKK